MDDHSAMLAIQELLDGTVWSADTLGEVADILTEAGYRVRDADDCDVPRGATLFPA